MSGRSCNRKMIDPKYLIAAFAETMQMADKILYEKGMGSFASRHELNGINDEEFYEVELEFKKLKDRFENIRKISHDEKHSFKNYRMELMQLAIGCEFGIACIDAGGLEW